MNSDLGHLEMWIWRIPENKSQNLAWIRCFICQSNLNVDYKCNTNCITRSFRIQVVELIDPVKRNDADTICIPIECIWTDR